MKIKFMSALDNAPKLVSTVVLSAFLVACGGGSGDETDDGTTDGVLTAGDGGADDGFSDLDLGGDDLDGTVDGGFDGGIVTFIDSDGDGVADENEGEPCLALGGTDPGSGNEMWNDNCWLQERVVTPNGDSLQHPFSNSTYVVGAQRVLFCRGHGGVADSIGAFSDGLFGPNTNNAVRAFQETEGLVVDGIVGPATWGRMQELVDTPDTFVLENSNDQYDAFGVALSAGSGVDCEQLTNFYARAAEPGSPDTYEAWELALTPGGTEQGSFSIARAQ